MTHDKGFHIKPKNLRILLSFFSSSLLAKDPKPLFTFCCPQPLFRTF
jgi:hypothetical protein